jgi:hypothetical protein
MLGHDVFQFVHGSGRQMLCPAWGRTVTAVSFSHEWEARCGTVIVEAIALLVYACRVLGEILSDSSIRATARIAGIDIRLLQQILIEFLADGVEEFVPGLCEWGYALALEDCGDVAQIDP